MTTGHLTGRTAYDLTPTLTPDVWAREARLYAAQGLLGSAIKSSLSSIASRAHWIKTNGRWIERDLAQRKH